MNFIAKIAFSPAIGFFLLIVSIAPLQAEGIKTLVAGDGKANRLNMTFFAEGYTQAQQTKFINDVRENINRFFLCMPWANYKSFCNAYAIGVVSADSGADHPMQGIVRNTYFESTFGSGTTASPERLVTIKNQSKVTALLMEHVPDYDFVCVLVNDPQYGGSGGSYSVATLSSQATFLIFHETGHGFAYLADEYEDAYSDAAERKNVTAKTQRDQIRWNIWIAPSTPVPTPETSEYFNVVGIFEGAMYHTTGWYRPKYSSCAMRTTGSLVFCEVCREEVTVGIFNVVSLIDSFSPPNAATIKNKPGAALSVHPLRPDSSRVKTQWSINGSLVSNASDSLVLAGAGLQIGLNKVIVRVIDTTSMVRIPANLRFLTDTLAWTIDNSETNAGPISRFPEERFRIVRRTDGMRIVYSLHKPQSVRIALRDVRGSLLYTACNAVQAAGTHEAPLCDQRIGSGVYIIELVTNNCCRAETVEWMRNSSARAPRR